MLSFLLRLEFFNSPIAMTKDLIKDGKNEILAFPEEKWYETFAGN